MKRLAISTLSAALLLLLGGITSPLVASGQTPAPTPAHLLQKLAAPQLLDERVRSLLYFEECDVEEMRTAYEWWSTRKGADWQAWQWLPFMQRRSQEVAAHLPYALKAIAAQCWLGRTITVDRTCFIRMELNNTQIEQLIEELIQQRILNTEGQLQAAFRRLAVAEDLALSSPLLGYRAGIYAYLKNMERHLHQTAGLRLGTRPTRVQLVKLYDRLVGQEAFQMHWEKIYKKPSSEWEKMKAAVLEASIAILQRKLQNPLGSSYTSPLYIHTQKSPTQDQLQACLSPEVVRLLHRQLVQGKNRKQQERFLKKIKRVQQLREKLSVYADRMTKPETFFRLCRQYQQSYEAYAQHPQDRALLKPYLRQVLLMIAVNQYPLRTRFARFPGQEESYLYDDDDSASSYTYLKMLFYALDQGWLRPEAVVYDPFFGSGSFACLTQLLPIRHTVGTELLLCAGPGSAGGWYMEVEKNLRLFNQSVLERFGVIFAPLGLPMEVAPSLFGEVMYTQADARQVLGKDTFALFSQPQRKVFSADAPASIPPEQHVCLLPFKLQGQPIRLIVANPPWGISTTTLQHNDVEAFTCFFGEMLPTLKKALAPGRSGIVLHLPSYWVRVLLGLSQTKTATDFAELFFAQRAQDSLLNDQLPVVQARAMQSKQQQAALEATFGQLKKIFPHGPKGPRLTVLDEKLLVIAYP